MTMVKTDDLQGAALNWAVATAGGAKGIQFWPNTGAVTTRQPNGLTIEHDYSTNWNKGGPIIEQEGIVPARARNGKVFVAWKGCASDFGMVKHHQGATPLIAAMRCFVASKLGEQVDVPDELLTQQAPAARPARPRG